MSTAFAVEITEAAEQDLRDIVGDISRRTSARAADRLLDDLLECVGALERFPERGAFPDELAELGIKDFRQLFFQNYRLIYRVIGKRVVVMVIADGRQDLQRVLERRLLGGWPISLNQLRDVPGNVPEHAKSQRAAASASALRAAPRIPARE